MPQFNKNEVILDLPLRKSQERLSGEGPAGRAIYDVAEPREHDLYRATLTVGFLELPEGLPEGVRILVVPDDPNTGG